METTNQTPRITARPNWTELEGDHFLILVNEKPVGMALTPQKALDHIRDMKAALGCESVVLEEGII